MQLVLSALVSSLLSFAPCTNSKPLSPPVLRSIDATHDNQLTLSWNKAEGAVTHYSIFYGRKPDNLSYSNNNAGRSDTYTIKGLSGGSVYYFKIKAVNGCMEGDYSNVLSALTTGTIIDTGAEGFTGLSPNDDVQGEAVASSELDDKGVHLAKLIDNNREVLSALSALTAMGFLYYFFIKGE